MEVTRRIVPFRPRHRADVVALWNQIFESMHGFSRLDRVKFRRVVEGAPARDPFRPELFLVASEDDRVCGFVHGGIWQGPFLERLLPETSADAVGYMAAIGVAPWCRRRGWGRALLAELRDQLEKEHGIGGELRVDGRVFNPFYGNFLGPRAPFWGTTEGIAVAEQDEATRAFLVSEGFREVQQAVSMQVRPTQSDRSRDRLAELECITAEDYQPILGSGDGMRFPCANDSRSWVLVENDVQVAALVAYPFQGDRSSTWGIHSLEVHESARGRGLAARLLERVLGELATSGTEVVETLVLPGEAPAAVGVYEQAGFTPVAAWVIFE